MAEKTWTATAEDKSEKEPEVGTEEWAKLHRTQIQQQVRARAQNATNLMREIEKIRPAGEGPEGKRAGRIPKVDPKTGRPYAHVILGFKSWSDFVREKQPDGLGWSPDHERVMWLGWRKAQAAGITPEMIDELGQAWLAEIGGNKKKAGETLSIETAQARIDQKRELARGGQKRKGDENGAASGNPIPEGPAVAKPSGTDLAKRQKDGAPLTNAKTPKAVLNAFLEQATMGIEAKDALKAAQAVLPHLDPNDTALVAEEIIPKLESDVIGGILSKMVPMLDERELWDVTRASIRKLSTEHLRKAGEDAAELLKARLAREQSLAEDAAKAAAESAKAEESTKATEAAKAEEAPKAEEGNEKPNKKDKKGKKKAAKKP